MNTRHRGSSYESEVLMCQNKCGFYANWSQYDGYCSMCYRQRQAKTQAANHPQQRPHSDTDTTHNTNDDHEHDHDHDDDDEDDNDIIDDLVEELFCRNKCGFYGNATLFDGYCSLCYKQVRMSNSGDNSNSNSNSNSSSSTDGRSSSADEDSGSGYSSSLEDSLKSNNATAEDDDTFGTDSKNKNNKAKESARRSSSGRLGLFRSIHKTSRASSMSSVSSKSNDTKQPQQQQQQQQQHKQLAELYACLNELISDSSNINALAAFEQRFGASFPQFYTELRALARQFVDKFAQEVHNEHGKTKAPSGRSSSLVANQRHGQLVQEFYKKMQRFVRADVTLRSLLVKWSAMTAAAAAADTDANDTTEKLYEAVMIMIESYVNTSIYDIVFPLVSREFDEADARLNKRIRDFHWISNDMIGTCLSERHVASQHEFQAALNNMAEMSSKRTAYEKMMCLTDCSKSIYKAINIAASAARSANDLGDQGDSLDGSDGARTLTQSLVTNEHTARSVVATADEYLPAFIYVVLRTNPSMLHSNINFISRFAFEKRLLQGADAYHFCSLNAIISYIENLNAEQLKMSEDEFYARCAGSHVASSDTNHSTSVTHANSDTDTSTVSKALNILDDDHDLGLLNETTLQPNVESVETKQLRKTSAPRAELYYNFHP